MMRTTRQFVLIAVLCIFGSTHSNNLGSQCTIKSNGQPGVCTVIQQCVSVWKLYEQGLIRSNPPTVCKSADKSVCCPQSEARIQTTTTTEAPKKMRISERKCKEYGQRVFKFIEVSSLILGEPPALKKVNLCLHGVVSLIVGGELAGEGEFPHMALLGYVDGEPQDYSCGGSLVSPDFVLTAAHCLYPRGYGAVKFIKLGANHRVQNDSYTFNVKEIFQHPNYDPKKLNNDIGLLKIDRPVPLSERILPICLPQKQPSPERAVATGFGKTGYGQSSSRDMLKVTLERFTQSECQQPFGNKVAITNDSMLCYGHHTESKDTCNGDSGGPLQIYNTEPTCTFTQIGLVSFGLKQCGTIGAAGVYSNIFHYLDWIESVVWPGEV